MDPYAPINGISLERYAELGAELDGITEPAAQQQKVGTLGVAAADWEAAKQGWTARMQDMSLMGQVATRYMQLYNAALASKKGVASMSFEDWCAVSACIQVFGYEGAIEPPQAVGGRLDDDQRALDDGALARPDEPRGAQEPAPGAGGRAAAGRRRPAPRAGDPQRTGGGAGGRRGGVTIRTRRPRR